MLALVEVIPPAARDFLDVAGLCAAGAAGNVARRTAAVVAGGCEGEAGGVGEEPGAVTDSRIAGCAPVSAPGTAGEDIRGGWSCGAGKCAGSGGAEVRAGRAERGGGASNAVVGASGVVAAIVEVEAEAWSGSGFNCEEAGNVVDAAEVS